MGFRWKITRPSFRTAINPTCGSRRRCSPRCGESVNRSCYACRSASSGTRAQWAPVVPCHRGLRRRSRSRSSSFCSRRRRQQRPGGSRWKSSGGWRRNNRSISSSSSSPVGKSNGTMCRTTSTGAERPHSMPCCADMSRREPAYVNLRWARHENALPKAEPFPRCRARHRLHAARDPARRARGSGRAPRPRRPPAGDCRHRRVDRTHRRHGDRGVRGHFAAGSGTLSSAGRQVSQSARHAS